MFTGFLSIVIAGIGLMACQSASETAAENRSWILGPFQKELAVNPVLVPGDGVFHCPVRGEEVRWEAKDVFNPAAVVRDGRVYMIFRAEDTVGRHAGTSRLGLAVSDDGRHFEKMPEPVFYPDNDSMKIFEWEGGVEDPRIVESPDGMYVMTYTAYDGKIARLCLATSRDLVHWKKHGLVLGEKYRDVWSKSGAIVCRRAGEKLLATPVRGKYWMYWGDTDIFACTSEDLIHWAPVLNAEGTFLKVFGPRKGKFDNQLVEPGPPPLLTPRGIVLIYNSRNHDSEGIPELPPGTYTAGQVLLDAQNPTRVLDRTEHYFFKPETAYEINGQVGNVVFLEALVPFREEWLLYYGTADSKIAVANSPLKN
ncbi:MAG: glycosidase [Bacteroidetes bacterium]|nr:MAG: glycosidase [Bacteroidota bacterium]